MKTGRVFWGVFFVVVGLLFLFGDRFSLDLDPRTIWHLWPVALILIGLAYLLKSPVARAIIGAVTAILVALSVYSVFSLGWINKDDADEVYSEQGQNLTQPYDSTMKNVSFKMEVGAGTFLLYGATDELITAATNTTFGRYSLGLERESMSDETKLTFSFEGNANTIHLRKMRNRAEVQLNTNPVWDVDIDAGAASLDFDLSPHKVERFTLDGGAASVKLKFGGRVRELRGRMKIGASSIRIEVPDSVACEVKVDTGLSSKHLPDFEKVGDNSYRTSNFDTAKNSIYLNIEAGVSSIRVVRY